MAIIEYRGYQIKPQKDMPSILIVVTSGKGGKIPAVLDSMFTKPEYAKSAIDSYLTSKERTVNGKASSES